MADTGLSCAVGIGETKLQAKIATTFGKPGGTGRLTRDTWFEVMGDEPVTAIWGIGTRIAERLADAGIRTVWDLARADHEDLARRFGPTTGPHLRVLGLGGGDSPVADEPHVPRGRSHEVTFEHDLTDPAEIEERIAELARTVTASVVDEGRRITHVSLKVRTAPFLTRTKISKLREPTTDPEVVVRQALVVLHRFEIDRPVRLLGVRVVLEDPPPGTGTVTR
jgi:DNA polymerase-4